MNPGRTTQSRTRSDFRSIRHGGFTLLELVIAVTLLAGFCLPVLKLLTESKVRAIKYTQSRTVRDLAQKKLHERIHYLVQDDAGTFELEGHSDWTWIVSEPVLKGQNNHQVLLQYTIQVRVPFKLEGGGSGGGSGAAEFAEMFPEFEQIGEDEGSTYEYSVWSFPNQAWLDDQEYLYETGQPSLLYGDPALEDGGAFPGALPGGDF